MIASPGWCIADTSNVALKKYTIMSTVYDATRNPGKSVNGNSDPGFDNCASTAHNDLKPWQVDLGNNYHVTAVLVTNRENYSYRLHDFTVTVSNDDVSPGTACGLFSGTVPEASTATLSHWGRYVKITKPTNSNHDVLTLCEVQVMAIERTRMIFQRLTDNSAMRGVSTSAITRDLARCVSSCKDSSVCLGVQYTAATDQCQLLNSTDNTGRSTGNGSDIFTIKL